jgi:hypothetical protein
MYTAKSVDKAQGKATIPLAAKKADLSRKRFHIALHLNTENADRTERGLKGHKKARKTTKTGSRMKASTDTCSFVYE